MRMLLIVGGGASRWCSGCSELVEGGGGGRGSRDGGHFFLVLFTVLRVEE